MNLKDKKILYELDRNSRLSLTQLAKKVEISKEVAHGRLKKLIDNGVILKFHTVSASYRLGLVGYKVYLRLFDLSQKDLESMKTYLNNHEDVYWTGICKGRWDLIFGIWARNIEEFFEIHDLILDKFNQFVQEKELSISRENIQYNRRWLYNNSKDEIKEFNFGEKESKVVLSEQESFILKELVQNSRKKIVDIALKKNISADSVSYSIKSMEKKGIIKGYKCLLNSRKLEFVTCKAFVYFKNITSQKKLEFIEFCKQIENTVNIVTTFAPWDLEIMFEVKNYEGYFELMDKIKEKFNDCIKFYESVLITEEPKQVFIK